jgi:hypothetical protein
MYVFSIDIPFNGSQSPSYMRSKVTVVSYLHSCVNDSAVHVTAVSLTLLCISQQSQLLHCAVFRIIRENFRQSFLHSSVNDIAVHITAMSMTPLYMSQRCQLLRCACHSVSITPLCNQLCRLFRKYEAIFRGRKSRVMVPLKRTCN